MAPLIFPTLNGITYPQKRQPKWNTVKQDALSGKRIRYSLYSAPVWQYELPLSFARSDSILYSQEWQTLMGFINSVFGATSLWQYLDPVDNAVTNQLFGQGTGTQTAFQLVRTLGGFTEPVYLPQAGFTVSIGGTPTVAFTQNAGNPGLITFTSAPANLALLTWTGTFYWPCRFDDDVTDMSQFMQNLWECKALKFSTEKI